MQAARQIERISVEDYLAGERRSEVRHEYLGGVVYAMAGSSKVHNLLTGNLFAALHQHLRRSPCRPYVADVLVRLRIATEEIFYYPDIAVACDARDTDSHILRFPKVLVEVLSPSTERIDRREKLLSYAQIETVEEYLIVAQDRMEAIIFRRANNWLPETVGKPDDSLRLTSLDFTLPLGAVYEGVEL